MDQNRSFILRVILLLACLLLAVWLLYKLAWLIALLLISLFIVYILHPPLLYLMQKFRLTRGRATALIFLFFLAFCVLTVSLLIPVVVNETAELAESFPIYLARVQIYISWLSQQVTLLDQEEEVRSFLLGLSENLNQAVEYLAEASLSLIFGAVDFVLVLFLVFYLLYDFQAVRAGLIELVPPAKRAVSERMVAIIDENLGTFIRGSLVRCVIVGTITGLTLFIAGMPYAFLLGIISGLFNFILYIGPYIAAVPAVLLALSPLTPSPLVVIVIYVIIQILDGLFLAPLVLGRIVKLKPITVIVAILAGGSLAGLLGMLVAVPAAGTIRGFVDMIKENYSCSGNDQPD